MEQNKNREANESFYIAKYGHAGERVLFEILQTCEFTGLDGPKAKISQKFSEKLSKKGLISAACYCIM